MASKMEGLEVVQGSYRYKGNSPLEIHPYRFERIDYLTEGLCALSIQSKTETFAEFSSTFPTQNIT